MILAAYSVNLVQEINDVEPYPDYYANIIGMKMYCDYDIDTRGFLKYWANCFSYQYIGHDRIIPIMASISIVYLVYVLANTITNNRIIGLISMAVMTQNQLLTKFDSSPTYDQVWVVFLLLSIILLYKKPILGLFTFPISIASKILAVGYLPAMFANVIMDKRTNRKVNLIWLSAVSIIGIATISFLSVGSYIGFYPERLLDGFLRIFESVWPIFPVIIGTIVIDRFFMPKEKIDGKKIVLVWIAWILLTTPLIYLFTEGQLQFGYRFVPFAAFFSIYFGMTCIQLGNFITEVKLRKQSLKRVL